MSFHAKSTASEVIKGHDLTGYEIIVTGGSSGIGIEIVRALAKANARVILAARDLTKANQVAEELRKDILYENNIEVELLDVSSLKSVREFVQRFLATKRHLNILINNAGIMASPYGKTEDGFELQFGTNHLGHFELFRGLLPALKEGAKLSGKNARVIATSSIASVRSKVNFDDPNFESRDYDPFISYGQSKTANALFAVGLTELYSADGIYANSLTPGCVMTGLQKFVSREEQIKKGWIDENGKLNPVFKTIEQGASTTIWAAVAPELENRGGLYLEDCQIGELKSSPQECFATMTGYISHALDKEDANRLWKISEYLINEASS